jgi:CRP-like cAMP-binding protein
MLKQRNGLHEQAGDRVPQALRERRMSPYRSTTHADCAACPATYVPFLVEGLPSRRELCMSHFRLAAFDAKQTIYDIGERGAALFILRRGLLKLVRNAPDGTERIVRLKRPGESFGLEALSGRPYHHRAVAVIGCEVCRLPAETVLGYGRDNGDVLQSILAQCEQAMETADMFLADLGTGSSHVRMARLLLFLAGSSDAAATPLPSREEMGEILDITTETASRVMAEFRRNALVEPVGEHRCRCDVEALAQIATQ